MEWGSGNIFIRPMRQEEAGKLLADGHEHNFDHTFILFTGRARIEATLPDGRVIVEELTAPAHRLIRRDVHHKITATAPFTEGWCVYAHRTPQGEVSQTYTGWMGAYS